MNRVENGKKWRLKLDVHQKLAENERYIRILGRGFRAISVSASNPCGKLVTADGSAIPNRRTLEQAIEDAFSAKDSKPGANKRELRAQAKLVRFAMQNDLRFHAELKNLSCELSELIFVTDEFAHKSSETSTQCRADMIALASYKSSKNRFFPIFIELKASRSLKKLLSQLDIAHQFLWKDLRNRSVFTQFLSAVSGVDLSSVENSDDSARKMLIWPESTSGKESDSVKEARTRGFIVVKHGFADSV